MYLEHICNNFIVFFAENFSSVSKLSTFLRIPVKSAIESGGSRPLIPGDSGHRFRAKTAGHRSEATLVF